MSNVNSYILYLICFAISIFWSGIYENKKKNIKKGKKFLYAILIILPVLILQGFRYEVGEDYNSYLILYDGFNSNDSLYISWYAKEPLFIAYDKVLYFITNGYKYSFFIADALIMNILLFLVIDYYGQYANIPIMYLFYYTWCLPYFFNVERQGLATILVWYSMKFVYEKKWKQFLFCILIATLMHNTAIVGIYGLIFIFFHTEKSNTFKRVIVLLGIMIPLIFTSLLNVLNKYFSIFSKYRKFLGIDLNEKELNTNFIITVFMVLGLLLLWNIWKNSEIDSYWILFICVLHTITYLLVNYIAYGFRMSFYFEFGLIYAYACIYKKLHYRTNKNILFLFVTCVCIFYFTYKFYIQGNSGIFPYNFIS